MVACIALLAALVIRVFYVGFQASDDANYVIGALGWLKDFPYVGVDHWTLRDTINIPTALFIGLFGLHEWSVSLTGILYYLAFLSVNGYCLARTLGRQCPSSRY